MEEQTSGWLGWILGAAAVVMGIAIYLWLTAPGSLLSETYTVM
jgi:hypothetical protein